MFQRVVLHNDVSGLTPNQVAVIRDIHTRGKSKYTCPDFGAKEDFALQLHIDARMLSTGRKAEAQELRNGVPFLLSDEANKQYFRFLDISGILPREERIRIPLVLTTKVARRIESTNPEWASLIVEINEAKVGVRIVCGKPEPVTDIDLSKISVAISRDFGYVNTVALSVLMADEAINLETQKRLLDSIGSKDDARALIKSHSLPAGVKVVERVRIEGHNFLNLLVKHCTKIDAYKSKIDLAYNELDKTREEAVKSLGLKPDELLTQAMKKGVAGVCVRRFFHFFDLIADLKKARRRLYRKIAAIKKAWFGFVSNIEVALAKKYNAVMVREHLTVEAKEKDAPDYKGRTFNKMLNNGSKGQYQKRASDKFLWNGVPEIEVPSWYTSRACLKHSEVIEKKHRKGEDIFLPCCDKHEHADEHAADTIGGFLFLKPLKELARSTRQMINAGNSVCDTSYSLA